jgi:hypothetical protein
LKAHDLHEAEAMRRPEETIGSGFDEVHRSKLEREVVLIRAAGPDAVRRRQHLDLHRPDLALQAEVLLDSGAHESDHRSTFRGSTSVRSYRPDARAAGNWIRDSEIS